MRVIPISVCVLLSLGLATAATGLRAAGVERLELMAGQTLFGGYTLFRFREAIPEKDDTFAAVSPGAAGVAGGALGLYGGYRLTSGASPNATAMLWQNSLPLQTAIGALLLAEASGMNETGAAFASSLLTGGAMLTAAETAGYARNHLTPGKITLHNGAALGGAVYTLGGYYILTGDRNAHPRTVPLLALAGGATGLGLAAAWDKNQNYTRGEIWRAGGYGLLGALVGSTVGFLFIIDDHPRIGVSLILSGGAYGVYKFFADKDHGRRRIPARAENARLAITPYMPIAVDLRF